MNAVAPLSSSDRSVVAPAVFSEFLTASLLILRAISRTNSRGIFGSAGRPRFRDFECQNIRKAVWCHLNRTLHYLEPFHLLKHADADLTYLGPAKPVTSSSDGRIAGEGQRDRNHF